jgi:hypothetical protein
VKNKLNQFAILLNQELRLFLSISLGVFLFVLFFEPFSLERFDANNKLVFVAGLGAIFFVFMVLIRVVLPWLMQNYEKRYQQPVLSSSLGTFIIMVLCSVAFPFYLHFVGSISITFYVMLKVFFICLAPSIALRLYDLLKSLRLQNEALIIEKKIIQKQVERYEEDYLNKSIEFTSENNTETMNLLIADVAIIKSADNYVEIIYTEDKIFKKKLLRNTMKNIEQQIKPYSNFIRCHRISIVNLHYIEKLNHNYNSHWLTIKGFSENIPVSRQYLLKLREAL